MKKVLSTNSIRMLLVSMLITISCEFKDKTERDVVVGSETKLIEVKIEAENLTDSSKQFKVESLVSGAVYVEALSEGWIAFEANIPVLGRFKSQIQVSSESNKEVNCWIEDYYDNKDDRIYNITGNMTLQIPSSNFAITSKDGTLLNRGIHKMKLHFNDSVNIDWVKFIQLK